jgi:cyclopropane fatty-acyl-phospholipid synthase-like methyltransferase
VVCIDAMEFMPPEDWPGILERFHRALRPGGLLYLTVELHPEDQVRERNQEARRSGLRLVKGEIVWDAPDGLLTTTTRRLEPIRAWLAAAGFVIEEEAEEPWHEELQLPASAGALGDVARLSIVAR